MLAELYSAVKPGGVVLVVDHVADPGTPDDVIAGLHRIDPALVKADFTAAGLPLILESGHEKQSLGPDGRAPPAGRAGAWR